MCITHSGQTGQKVEKTNFDETELSVYSASSPAPIEGVFWFFAQTWIQFSSPCRIRMRAAHRHTVFAKELDFLQAQSGIELLDGFREMSFLASDHDGVQRNA